MPILHNLIKEGNDLERLREFLKLKINPNKRNFMGDTPLHIVASKNGINPQDIEDSLRVARELINFGANVNKKNFVGKSPLIAAACVRNCRMVEFLLRAKAKIDDIDDDGNTALHHAIKECNLPFWNEKGVIRDPVLQVVKTILKFHPNVNIRNNFNETPLILAVSNNDLLVVKELLKRNASVHMLDIIDESAMHHALDQAEINLNIVLELIRHGGQFNIRNFSGETPMCLYLSRLLVAPLAEMDKAKHVFKLFLFGDNYFTALHQILIERISFAKNYPLSEFIGFCRIEISQMWHDELAPNYYVYNIAKRGFSYICEQTDRAPFHVFDKVLDKLMNSEYPVYCDLIVSGIRRLHLRKRFAEMCYYSGNRGRGFLNFDELCLLSFYLSHFDMLNMMLACSHDNSWGSCFLCLRRGQICSVL